MKMLFINRCLYGVAAILLATGTAGAVGHETGAEAVQYPDPGRWRQDMRVFEEWDNKNSVPSDAVVFVGSSSIRLWSTAKAFGGEYPVINRGFGGSYMADSVHYSETLILKYKPTVVVVFAGTNDIAGTIPAALVHRDFVRLVEIIHTALPRTEIIFLPITPTRSRWHLWNEMEKANALIEAYAAGKDYLTFVDVARAFLGPDGLPNPDLFVADQLHLNDKGYETWNSALAPVLRERYRRTMEKEGARKDDVQKSI